MILYFLSDNIIPQILAYIPLGGPEDSEILRYKISRALGVRPLAPLSLETAELIYEILRGKPRSFTNLWLKSWGGYSHEANLYFKSNFLRKGYELPPDARPYLRASLETLAATGDLYNRPPESRERKSIFWLSVQNALEVLDVPYYLILMDYALPKEIDKDPMNILHQSAEAVVYWLSRISGGGAEHLFEVLDILEESMRRGMGLGNMEKYPINLKDLLEEIRDEIEEKYLSKDFDELLDHYLAYFDEIEG